MTRYQFYPEYLVKKSKFCLKSLPLWDFKYWLASATAILGGMTSIMCIWSRRTLTFTTSISWWRLGKLVNRESAYSLTPVTKILRYRGVQTTWYSVLYKGVSAFTKSHFALEYNISTSHLHHQTESAFLYLIKGVFLVFAWLVSVKCFYKVIAHGSWFIVRRRISMVNKSKRRIISSSKQKTSR